MAFPSDSSSARPAQHLASVVGNGRAGCGRWRGWTTSSIRSPNPERAVALYAGRLGLSLRLDRSEPAWGARLLFFRCGDLIVEVAHDLKAGIGDGPDRLWGLSWRVPDIAKAHARLRAAGVAVSDLRAGRRPHTRVFTAKSHTAGVPTLVIGADPRQSRVHCSHAISRGDRIAATANCRLTVATARGGTGPSRCCWSAARSGCCR